MKTLRQSPGFPGPMTASRFLRQYWQKRPLLVRGAFPGFTDPLSAREVLRLAQHPDAASRMVWREARDWRVEHGPFTATMLQRRPKRNWTVLVQDTNYFSRRARELLSQFRFLPHARVDDLMVSYAETGGGVGPHVDSYDVFLIQGAGRRRWEIARQRDLAFVPGLDLKVLARFEPEQAWDMNPGDMLYLPPGVAHHGVALEPCLTWSVGFRSPSDAEFATAFLDQLAEKMSPGGHYRDPGLRPTKHPGDIPPALIAHASRVAGGIRWSQQDVRDFVGRLLSEPKQHAVFTAPPRPLSARAFAAAARRSGLRLDSRSRLLLSGRRVFLNGDSTSAPAGALGALRQLADARELSPGISWGDALLHWLYDAYSTGALHVGREAAHAD